MTLGIDVSHFTRDESGLTPDRLACLRQQGVRFVIVGTQDDAIFVPQMRMVLAAGLQLEAYIYLYAQVPGAAAGVGAVQQVDWTFDKLRDAGLLRSIRTLWLDVEDGFESGGLAANRLRLRQVVERCNAIDPTVKLGIYTRRGYWQQHMGNINDYAMLSLWDAYYDNTPSFGYFVPYGGWSRAHTKQYMNTNAWCGVNNDRNFREAATPEPEEPESDAGQVALDAVNFEATFERAVAGLRQGLFDLPGRPAKREVFVESMVELQNLFNLGESPKVRVEVVP